MNRKWNWITAAVFAATLPTLGGVASAQSQQGSQPPPAQQQGQQQTDKSKQQPNPAPLTLDATPPAAAASPEEEAAYKAFQAVPATDKAKRTQSGEDFIKKYPESRYRAVIYSNLASVYFSSGQIDKLTDVANKELALNPNDVSVMAIMALTLSRTYKANAPDAAKQLDTAEQYAKKTIELTPTLPKPDNLTDESFASAKADTMEMAHSSLGLIYLHRGKASDAIAELEDAVKVDRNPEPDPVNYYLLGLANDSTSHFDAAAAAFAKCGALQSTLQAQCQKNAEASKKKGATQLSAPK
ncbi:MAG TPA: hypothetical protein VGI16_08500 [Candidatus Acidoferrum sp.]|jgi:tetratricopeptide (TPR) repeat protein